MNWPESQGQTPALTCTFPCLCENTQLDISRSISLLPTLGASKYFLPTDLNLDFPGSTRGKEPVCQCRRHKRCGFDPWVRKIPGEGNGNPLQYSYLGNPMDRGAWWVPVHGIAKSCTQQKQLSMHARLLIYSKLPCFPKHSCKLTLSNSSFQDH